MRPAMAAAIGAVGSFVGTLCIAVLWALISVYLLGQVDVKFGAFGTVQLLVLTGAVGGIAGAGGVFSRYLVLLRRAHVSRPWPLFMLGMVGGAFLALLLERLLMIDVSPLPEVPGLIIIVALVGFMLNGLLAFAAIRCGLIQAA